MLRIVGQMCITIHLVNLMERSCGNQRFNSERDKNELAIPVAVVSSRKVFFD